MDSSANQSDSLEKKCQKEVLLLKEKILNRNDLSKSDLSKIQTWLEQIDKAPFARSLLLNKELQDGCVECWESIHPFDRYLFETMPCLTSWMQKHQTITYVLRQLMFNGLCLGVFPKKYEQEWSFFKDELEFSLVGLVDKKALFSYQNTFDICIKSSFLYENHQHEGDISTYLYNSLKPGGILVMSFWTSPDVNHSDSEVEALFFEQLLCMSKNNYQSTSGVKTRLRQVGFEHVQLVGSNSDPLKIIVARKPINASSQLKSKRDVSHLPRRSKRKGICLKQSIEQIA